MKVGKDFFDQDKAFLAIEKDLALIIQKIMSNQNLLKMLYYTQPDCLKAKDLTMTEITSMLNKQIRIVPKLNIEQECPNYIIITMDNFTPNKTLNRMVYSFSANAHEVAENTYENYRLLCNINKKEE